MPSDTRPSDQQRRGRPRVALLALCGLGLGLGALALAARRRNSDIGAPPADPAPLAEHTRRAVPKPGGRSPKVAAARGLNQASAMLAFSVLFDSAIEHGRADFFNKAMYAPLVSSTASIVASVHGSMDSRESFHALRHAALVLAGLTGLAGGALHVYNVSRREGGFVFQNLFYAAPLGAPYALVLSGLLGAAAEWVRDANGDEPRLLGVEADRMLAGITSLGLLGTVGEAGLLHFRGAFQNPAMVIPVTLPPVAAALLVKAAIEPRKSGGSFPLSRWWLGATATVGIASVFFHSYGVARMMGGWRNWRQNLFDGPPLPAPPSFTGLALAGIAALRLAERSRHG